MTAQQLKNSILQMAVQGKLVPQDPSDEPASVLLERIQAEKAQMVKEGKIKKEKNPSIIFRGDDNLPYEKVGDSEPVCIADEVPFEIPDSWEWARLSSVNDLYTGNSISEVEKKNKYMGLDYGYFYIGTKDVSFDHKINYDNGVRIPPNLKKFRIAPSDSILLCIEGGSAGRKISFTNQDVCFGNKLCCFISHGINYMFLYYFLQSPFFQMAFKKNTTGIIGGVSLNTLKEMLFPVPPIEEQQRIVSKIRLLEPYLSNQEKVETTLNSLTAEFPDSLKKSILQQAVQGKLVPQDPADEPASILLEKIRTEKEQMIKDGKIKRDKHESIIYRRDDSFYEKVDGVERCIDDEIPFEIPESWEWTRLINIYNFIDYRGATPTKTTSGIRLITAKNVKKGFLDYSISEFITEKEYLNRQSRGVSHKGDILFTTEAPLGNVAIADLELYSAGQRLITMQQYTKETLLSNNFTMFFFLSNVFQEQLLAQCTGTTVKGIKAEKLKKLLIAVPPYIEQQNIVNKIEKVFHIIELSAV